MEGEDVFKNLLKLCPDEEILGKSNVLRAYASSLYNKDPQDKEATSIIYIYIYIIYIYIYRDDGQGE